TPVTVTASPISTYGAGTVNSACQPPVANRWVQIFVTTAIMPSSTATATARSMARIRPVTRRAPATQATTRGTVTTRASVHAGTGGRFWASPGGPPSTKNAQAAGK